MGLRVPKTPVRSPRANARCERPIGTIRRECLDFLTPRGNRRSIARSTRPRTRRGAPLSRNYEDRENQDGQARLRDLRILCVLCDYVGRMPVHGLISDRTLLQLKSRSDALRMLRDEGPLVPLAGCTDVYVSLNAGTLRSCAIRQPVAARRSARDRVARGCAVDRCPDDLLGHHPIADHPPPPGRCSRSRP